MITSIPPGALSRWSFGVIILTHLISYNECGSVCVLVAGGFATINSLLMVYSKNGLQQIQIPYLRASQKFDFVCLFLALWMELLSLVAVNSAIFRTISFCLDAMSGSVIRIYILGRNSSINEPWPDVLGVVIVFVVSFMFIMGLENSKIFTLLMVTSVLSISGLLAIVTHVRGNMEIWHHGDYFPKGMSGILSASALLVMSFPNNLSVNVQYSKVKAACLSGSILVSMLLTAGCLSTLIGVSNSDKSHEYETVPILQILDSKDLHKLIPAISCLYVIACSGILLEIFPETFNLIARLAKSEWKILLKQIGYESRDTGNASLAVFVCGSLVAILTFACPLQNLTFIIAGSQLTAGVLYSFFFLYSPHRPKSANLKQDSSLSYSRLETGETKKIKSTTASTASTSVSNLPRRSATWFFNKAMPSLSTQNLSKSLNKLNKTGRVEEREWLLLDGRGEPSSPSSRPQNEDEELNAESSILSESSDVDCIAKVNGGSESSDEEEEDIDSIVEEFQQKLKISTAGLKDMNLKIPTVNSWRCSIICVILIIFASILCAIGFNSESILMISMSILILLITNLLSLWLPKYTYSYATPSTFTCSMAIFSCLILISFITLDSWLAIIFWLLSGIVLAIQSLVKCDVLCCLCLDYPRDDEATIIMEEHLGSSNGITSAMIHIKNPPKGMSIINHVQRS